MKKRPTKKQVDRFYEAVGEYTTYVIVDDGIRHFGLKGLLADPGGEFAKGRKELREELIGLIMKFRDVPTTRAQAGRILLALCRAAAKDMDESAFLKSRAHLN